MTDIELHNERANFPDSHEILPMSETVIAWLKSRAPAILSREAFSENNYG
jgi:hypothetical protein